MINKGTACDKVRNSEPAYGKAGAAAEPERQPAGRADRHIELDRERDRDDVMLDEAAERDEYRRTEQADPIRWSRNVTDKAAEHYRLGQSLWVVGRDPAGCNQITKAQGSTPAEDRIDPVTAETANCSGCQNPYGEKRTPAQ
jgi:hypothetical protein